MLKNYFLFLFIFGLNFGYSQRKEQKELPVPHIRLKAGVKKDAIALRWAVDEPVAWQKANKIGFQLKRYTLVRNGKTLSVPEQKDLGKFLPKPEKEWRKYVEENDNAAIVAQSLFGESFEVEMGEGKKDGIEGIINKSQEIDQRFAFALMAADLDFKVAELAGWAYVDKDAKPNEKYLYSVSINTDVSTSLLVEKGSAVAQLSDYQDLPKPLDFIGIFQDKTVLLAWEYLQLRDIYTSYFIEKSENGRDFKPLGDLPVMNMNDKDGKPAQGMTYADSLAQNNVQYSYRIRGKTIFGDYGPYSEIVSGAGKKAMEGAPMIKNFDVISDDLVKIEWEFPKESENQIVGFELLHSETDGQNTYKVVQKNISRNQRSIVTKNITPSNYFKIRAIGDNNQTESFSILVQLYDETPPAVPVGLTGKIDSTGIVRLEWKANTEKDLGGYHVFRGVQKGEEMMRLTPEMITKNTFEDKVALENLNSKVYYYVVSLDKRKNQSQPSEIIEIEKPDKVRPEAPVFAEYKLEDTGDITLKWHKSHSDDAVLYQLFRKDIDEPKAPVRKIYETKNIDTLYSYTDKQVENNKRYVYYLQAVDKSNLVSDKSLEITLRSNKIVPAAVITNLAGSTNGNKKMIELNWKNKSKNISEIIVYRQKGDEKPTLWGTLSGKQEFLEDKIVSSGNVYTYYIKPMLENNQVAKTEKITINF
jgi:hypothetical protein